jgi:hypothetical protein
MLSGVELIIFITSSGRLWLIADDQVFAIGYLPFFASIITNKLGMGKA